jgi:hypothetical protein
VSQICAWCELPIVGRHRLANPYSFRGWTAGAAPVLLSVSLVFHRSCWRDVKQVATDAERATTDGLTTDLDVDAPPALRCECGRLIYAGLDHHCTGVTA